MDTSCEPPELLVRLRKFCFPGGEEPARLVRAIRTRQQGEIRSSPKSRWVRFSAEETIETHRSSFCWEAWYQGGGMGWVKVIDAYENGHGQLAIKLGGVIPVRKAQGPEFDKGELQRYLASVTLCPPILLNHPTLAWTALDSRTLRVRDLGDPTGAEVSFEVKEDGRPLACRAVRPRAVGKDTVATRWLGTCLEFREYEGLRAASRIEVAWEPPEGLFAYLRAEITSYEILA